MANWQWFTKVHKGIYSLSGGRLGANMGGQTIVMMNTIGRKSGQLRQVPVACYPYKNNVVVVASNNGMEKHPIWWLNLQATPIISIQLGEKKMQVCAEELKDEARESAWQALIKINRRQKHYQSVLPDRELPVVYLKPVD